MPSKKKKYNARFPPARIKKIMQTDEEVGKVAAAVPVIISRALELFIDSLLEKTAAVTRAKNAKTLSSSHIKQAIHSEKTFDFLQDLVKNVPDHQTEEDVDNVAPSGSGTAEKKQKVPRPRKPREEGARGPGRPRKVKVEEKKESASEHSDEETETDEEHTADEESHQPSPTPHGHPAQSPYGQATQSPHGPPYQTPQGQPMQSTLGQPMQSPHGQPMQSPHGQPMQSPHGQPMQSPLGQPMQTTQSPHGQSMHTPQSQDYHPTQSPQSQPAQSPHGQTSASILSPGGQYGLQTQAQVSPGPLSGNTTIPGASMPNAPVMTSDIPHPQITSAQNMLSPPPQQQGSSVPTPVSNMPGDQPPYTAPYPNPTQGQPHMSAGQQQYQVSSGMSTQQHQALPGMPKVPAQYQGPPGHPAGFPMHNMGYPPYPHLQYMGGGLPSAPYMHPQTSHDYPLPSNPNMQHSAYSQSGMAHYRPPPHFMPPHPSFMLPSPMDTNDPRFMPPVGVSGRTPMVPPPLFTMQQNRPDDSGDASLPLDMSLAGKTRSPSTETMSTSDDRRSQSHAADGEFSSAQHQSGQPQQWNNKINQNMIDLTVSKSQTIIPPAIVRTSETQSNNRVTENGKHKQNSENIAVKSSESKVSRNPSEEKTVSFPGLANIMNMKPVKTSKNEDNDDDYDS